MSDLIDRAINEAVGWIYWAFRMAFRIGVPLAQRTEAAIRAKQGKKPYQPLLLEPMQGTEIAANSETSGDGGLRILAIVAGLFLCYGLVSNSSFFFLVGAAGVGYFWYTRRQNRNAPVVLPTAKGINFSEVSVHSILLPRSSEWDRHAARQLMQQSLTNFGAALFRIVATSESIGWQMVDVRKNASDETLERTIRSIYPEAEVRHSQYEAEPSPKPFFRLLLKCCPKHFIFPAPIAQVEAINDADPLIPFTQALNDLEEGERVVYSVYVPSLAAEAQEKGMELVTHSNVWVTDFLTLGGGVDAVARKATGQDRVEAFAPEFMKVMNEKLQKPLYHTLVMVEINAPKSERLGVLTTAVTNLLQFEKSLYNAVDLYAAAGEGEARRITTEAEARASDSLGLLSSFLANQSSQWQELLFVLEPSEIAALWHLPHQSFGASDVAWIRGKQVQVPKELTKTREGVLIGDNLHSGHTTPVYMPYPDRTSHMAVFGMTGVGKSNYLHTLVAQDLAHGKGVCVVDPLGKLVRNLLRFSIPPEREEEVVVLDVACEDYPPPFNLMAAPKAMGSQSAASSIMGVLQKVYPEMLGTRWLDTLAMAVQTLRLEETATIRDVMKVLTNASYRDELLARTENDVIHEFWERFEEKSDAHQNEFMDPIEHRLRGFYGNEFFYRMTCHPDTLDLAALMREQKIILVSLNMDEAKLPERERRLLGALLVSQVQMAALSHACEQNGFYLYVDEAQNFVTTALDTMLTQARQFNLSVNLANQFLKQLVGDTLDTVRGVVGTWVFFQLGDEDAPLAARYASPHFEAEDFIQMDKYQAVVRMRLAEKTLPAFNLTPHLAFVEGDGEALRRGIETEERIRQLSMARYTPKAKGEVMAWLRDRYPRKKGRRHAQDDAPL